MSPDRLYFVYILASNSRVLYTGVTNNLLRRLYQHRQWLTGFTSRYAVNRLVYFESTVNSRAAVAREREIKRWTREKKLRLIESANAGWVDLEADWLPGVAGQDPSLRSG